MQKHNLEEPVAATVISHRFSHTVWGAVFAGMAIITVTQLALTLLGSSIGFSTLNITQGNNIKALGIGAIGWWIISGCISFYMGGLVSGRMAGIPRRLDGMLHGLLAYSVTTLFMFLFLTTSLGVVIAGGLGILNSGAKTISAMAPQLASAAQDIVPEEVNSNINRTRNEIRKIMTQIQDPAKREQLRSSLMSLVSSNDPNVQKREIVTLLTQTANMDPLQAQNMVNRWSQNIQTIKQELQNATQQAGEASERASRVAGEMAFSSFVMLLLGAFAAGLGGAIGAPHWSDQEII
jgi:hypothetical protein